MGNATSSDGMDNGAVATARTTTAGELCLRIEDNGTRIRLTSTYKRPRAWSQETNSIHDEFRKILYEQVQLKPEDISKMMVVGDTGHLLLGQNSGSAMEKFLNDLRSLPRLNDIAFFLSGQTTNLNICLRQMRPFLESLSVKEVKVWRDMVLLKSGSLNLQIRGKKYHQLLMDALVKEILSNPTAQSLQLSDNFSGPQTFAAMCDNGSNHLTELTLERWREPPGDFVMQTLANALRTRSQKRKRDSGEGINTTPLRLQKLTLKDTKLLQADFELLADALKTNNFLREFHVDRCKIMIAEAEAQQGKERLRNSIMFSILKENIHLVKFSFTRMHIELLFAWGISVGEVCMSTDFPILCQVLENDNHTIQSIDFGTGVNELPLKAKLYLALNTFGFRNFMGKSPYQRDDFLRILIRAKEEDLNIDTVQHLVPCLFEMFRSNPMLVEWLSFKEA